MATHSHLRKERIAPIWIGLVIGVTLCCAAIWFQLEFRRALEALPVEATVRPSAQAVIPIGLAVGGLIIGVPYAILGIAVANVERQRYGILLGVVALVMNLLPMPISIAMSKKTYVRNSVKFAP